MKNHIAEACEERSDEPFLNILFAEAPATFFQTAPAYLSPPAPQNQAGIKIG